MAQLIVTGEPIQSVMLKRGSAKGQLDHILLVLRSELVALSIIEVYKVII